MWADERLENSTKQLEAVHGFILHISIVEEFSLSVIAEVRKSQPTWPPQLACFHTPWREGSLKHKALNVNPNAHTHDTAVDTNHSPHVLHSHKHKQREGGWALL